eukprot:1158188-Pelagomonas_calceolata.AAC.13
MEWTLGAAQTGVALCCALHPWRGCCLLLAKMKRSPAEERSIPTQAARLQYLAAVSQGLLVSLPMSGVDLFST